MVDFAYKLKDEKWHLRGVGVRTICGHRLDATVLTGKFVNEAKETDHCEKCFGFQRPVIQTKYRLQEAV